MSSKSPCWHDHGSPKIPAYLFYHVGRTDVTLKLAWPVMGQDVAVQRMELQVREVYSAHRSEMMGAILFRSVPGSADADWVLLRTFSCVLLSNSCLRIFERGYIRPLSKLDFHTLEATTPSPTSGVDCNKGHPTKCGVPKPTLCLAACSASLPAHSDSPDTLGQTIVKLHEGQSEPPLIMIPGAGCLAFHYISYTDKFRTAVWTLQVASETPLNILEDMAAFYLCRIKAERPLSPYRFAAYSQTSALLIILVKLFEDNGDVVLQVVMLDHFPTLLVYFVNQARNADPRIPENMEAIFEKGTRAITEMMRRDGNPHPLLRSLKVDDAWQGKCDNDIVQAVSKHIKSYLTYTVLIVPLMRCRH
ncbi:hypothetical protein F5146DRAFT_1145593 [Armillaria mellea]|nr:hypothetical protein F5146DRAFT_1145593 [Armillaria mellea]